MKLIRIVKLQRVPYGDLDEGDEYAEDRGGILLTGYTCSKDMPMIGTVAATDTDKYPPEEVTYTIEGVDSSVWKDGYFFGLQEWELDESEIETRYV